MNNLSGKILAIVLSLFLVAYVGYQVYRYIYSPVKTESVQQYVVADTVYAPGIVLRDEETVDGVDSGIVSYYFGDGVRVITGTPVAEVHESRENVQKKHRIEEIDREIQRLADIQKAASGVADVASITEQIDEQITGLIEMNHSGVLTSSDEILDGLQDALNKKAVAIREVSNFSGKIAALENEKVLLQEELSVDVSQILSPSYGYFTSFCDTGAKQCGTSLLESASVAKLEELSSAVYEQQKDKAGTVIQGYHWYYAALVTAEEAERMEVGTMATLYFGASSETGVPAYVSRVITDDTSEKIAVVFTCDYMSAELSQMRNPSVRIELGTYRGLKIPYKALRFQDGLQGVYVVTSGIVEFKKVDIIYDDVTFFLSSIDSNNTDLVQMYDDIVTEGTDLYEGKNRNS
ncbi:MAG: hypothetical protein IJM93_06385 [Oscillospiraceae bacterium]|nr:hypothetical protein [Oscillospiraceae bacterium]